MSNHKRILISLSILFLISLLVTTQYAYSVYTATASISISGNIIVMADLEITSNGASPLTTLNWGVIRVNQTNTQYLYIKNVADVPMTLSATPSNWLPPGIEQNFTFAFSLNDVTLQINENRMAQMNLTLSQAPVSNQTAFSFNIVIAGTA